MQVLHKINNVSVEGNVDDGIAFLLGNKNKGYVYFSEGKRSRYEGVFFNIGGKMIRSVAEIRLREKALKLVNMLYCLERHSAGNKETFFMPYEFNALVYELDKVDWITPSLDVRNAYETRGQTNYELTLDDSSATIRCERDSGVFFLYLLAEQPEYEKIEHYETIKYERDLERNSPPYEGRVYNSIRIKSKKIVLAFSDNREKAKKDAQWIYSRLDTIRENHADYTTKIILKGVFALEDVWSAYNCCINSLNQLTSFDEVVAGFPWFFQNWTRDELVAVSVLSPAQKKKIIMKYMDKIMDDGRVPNILPEKTTNADSVGWLFKRVSDSLDIFENSQRNIIRERLIESIIRLNETYVKDLLIYNRPQDTWMDTLIGGGREGARIEIQALLLNMYNLAYRLTQNEKFRLLEQITVNKVRSIFWNGRYLKDGSEDATIRPNVFIAAYVYPDLLKKDEWETCFDNILPHLWCQWGGFASVEKTNRLFCSSHTGEDPRSYHNGDSWYFLNNIAAIVLNRINPEKYRAIISQILTASTKDVLWAGFIGHHSELSDASEQKAGGCGAQAWSAATYIELIKELYKI